MVNNDSPFVATRQLDTQLKASLSPIDIYAVPAAERRTITTLQRDIVDVRLDVRDYELSETRAEQMRKAAIARKRLERIRHNILLASEYNIFSAIDVAQLSAQIEQIIESVK